MEIITYKDVESRIVKIRDMSVLINSDVSDLYQIGTKEVNQAVSRNKGKFPEGYIIDLTLDEKRKLVTNCDRFRVLRIF